MLINPKGGTDVRTQAALERKRRALLAREADRKAAKTVR